VPMETIEKYLHSLYRMRPDFVHSVSRDFAKSCQTPMLVLPDDVTAHPLQVSIDIASLAPNAEITVFPWKDPPELNARTINRPRPCLKRHRPAYARNAPPRHRRPRREFEKSTSRYRDRSC